MIELKKDSYYKFYDSDLDMISYIKFKYVSGTRLYCDSYEITEGVYLACDSDYCDYGYFERYKIQVEEIELCVIIDLLPNTNIDKIVYKRNQKIKILLNA